MFVGGLYVCLSGWHHVRMKILLADDHQLFLDGLYSILRQKDASIAITCVRDGHEVLACLKDDLFDVALIDLRLPGRDGFELLERLGDINSLTPIIIVTASEDPDDQRRALKLGAAGFVPKSASGEQIWAAIRAVLRGEVVDAECIQYNLRQAHLEWARMHKITMRQLQVLRLLGRGLSNADIAGRLSLSLPTVKSHVGALFRALGARSRTEVVEKARRLGLE